MNERNKSSYVMTDEDLKALKRALKYVKKLDIFDENKDKENKNKKIKKVA